MARRRNRKTNNNRSVKIVTTKQLQPYVPSSMVVQRVTRPAPMPKAKKGRNNRGVRKNRAPIRGVTNPGLAFLKCAFAPPDFGVDPGQGIVDKFQGRTINIKDSVTTALDFDDNKDTYILSLPIPGYQYFVGTAAIGSVPTTFQGVPFPTYSTNFGDGTTLENNYTRFRYAGGAIGLYPTSNMTQFAGSVQVWRVDVNMSETLNSVYSTTDNVQVGTAPIVGVPVEGGTFQTTSCTETSDVTFTPGVEGDCNIMQTGIVVGVSAPTLAIPSNSGVVDGVVSKKITGLRSVTSSSPRDSYNDSFIKGMYGVQFDRTDDFQWSDFVSADQYTDGNIRLLSATGKPLKGLGNLNGLVLKVSTPEGAINAALLRIWMCMEMQPNTDGALYQFSKLSPPHDPLAIELYHKYAERLPVAVPCAENGLSWEKFMKFAQVATAAIGKYAPVAGSVFSAISDIIGGFNAWAF